ncbi:hypothetical protein ABZ705_32065 [Streptomyces sp. NPDC006984]|uniref:hypothetical protein n=1 Tax=Streptomyces sp. NPDC006984 TaxID=3155463 RepID=UPI00340D9166
MPASSWSSPTAARWRRGPWSPRPAPSATPTAPPLWAWTASPARCCTPRGGASVAVPGLVFVGLEWQRSLSSNSLRGVGRDADRIARHVAAHLRGR